MSEPALKCKTYAVLSKTILKTVYCFYLIYYFTKSRFSRFRPKSFIISTKKYLTKMLQEGQMFTNHQPF